MNKTRDNGVNIHLARNNKQWVWEHILGVPFELCNDATYTNRRKSAYIIQTSMLAHSIETSIRETCKVSQVDLNVVSHYINLLMVSNMNALKEAW